MAGPTANKLCSAAIEAMERVGELADCTLVAADGSAYKVNKAVAAVHSKVLGALFKDINQDTCHIPLDDSSAEVACLLNHMYGGDEFLIDRNNLQHCSRMAQKYDMPRLQRAVEYFVYWKLSLRDDNIAHRVAVAFDNPALHKLQDQCMDFMAKHLQRACRVRADAKLHPTDWLDALPQSVLVDLMERRCRCIAAAARLRA